MNQILSTEREVNGNKKEKKTRRNASTNDINIHSIVKFFAIVMIVFGICVSSNGVYAFMQSNKVEEIIAKPSIYIEREDEENVIIRISSSIGLKDITYSVNSKSTTIDGQEQMEKEIPLKLEEGSNNVIVTAKDKKKQESTYQKTFEIVKGPDVKFEQGENAVKVIATSKVNIDYIEYWWDNEESKKEMINNTEAEISIDVIPEQHTLNIRVVDINGNKVEKNKQTVGVKAPKLSVTTNLIEFVIEASDEKAITKVEITFNGQELPVEEVNSATYTKKLKLKQGENKIVVTVYNEDNVSTVDKRQWTME